MNQRESAPHFLRQRTYHGCTTFGCVNGPNRSELHLPEHERCPACGGELADITLVTHTVQPEGEPSEWHLVPTRFRTGRA